jgi:lysophospholipase L1-like esterase
MSTAAPWRKLVQGACGECRGLLLALIAGISLAVAFAVPATAETPCPAGPGFSLRLPHLRAALDSRTEGLIVALGSSSTAGAAASDLAHSYPAELQAALSASLRRAHVAVINRGIGGQDAPEELSRLDADVIALHPQLVIWQVGANGALRNEDPAMFRAMVTVGVRRLQSAGADVILMDSQHSALIMASADHQALEESLAEVATGTGANLFSRGELMDAWAEEGAPPSEFLASDGLHQNDRGYVCVAQALAADIVAGLHEKLPLSASR